MKPSSLVLAVSLVANGCLAAWLVVAPAEYGGHVFQAPPGKNAAAERTALAKPVARAANRPAAPLWSRLDAGQDFKTLIGRLGAAGFPPAVVRAIITALVTDQSETERSKIDTAALHTPYWKSYPNSYFDPKIGPALRKIARDRQALLKELLGEGGNEANSEEAAAWRELAWGNLSPEKNERLQRAVTDYNEKRLAIYSAAGAGRGATAMLPADRAKLLDLDRELRSGLGEFLTPAEIEDYNLRSSEAANQLKSVVGPMRVSEAEFRRIFPLYQDYLNQFPTAGAFGPPARGAVDPAQTMAQEALVAQVASTLGAERAEELRVALDPKLAGIMHVVSRLDLPLTVTKQVYDVQQDVQQRAARVQNDPGLAAVERATQLAALQKEALDKLTQTLGGTRGVDFYRQYGGQWLSDIAPAPKG